MSTCYSDNDNDNHDDDDDDDVNTNILKNPIYDVFCLRKPFNKDLIKKIDWGYSQCQ